MDIDIVYNLFSNLHNDNLSFIYQGNFNDEITERIIDISETNIMNMHEQGKINNKVSFLLAECFQNVIRHGENINAQNKSATTSGIFITRNIGKSYYISSANLIENKFVRVLKSKINQINNLSPEKLKEMYIKMLTKNEFSNKGGAGLGLIEMARKSGQKLDFEFETVDKENSFFYLQIKLENLEDAINRHNDVNVKVAKEFHHLMSADNIFIIHKGDFSQHTIIPILRMIEDNLYVNTEKNTFKKKIYHKLVEILQNVSKHAFELNGIREGIFLMGKQDEKYLIGTGNYIKNSMIGPLSKHIDNLNILNKDELLQLYKYTLHLGTTTMKGDAGLGLIDIARDSLETIKYKFTKINDDYSFYAFHSTI